MNKSMQVFSSEEMKAYDAWVSTKFKIPENTLVEHAGRECFNAFNYICDLGSIESVLFLCGSGGNGADALVLARLLKCSLSYLDSPVSMEIFLTKPFDQQRDLNKCLLEQLSALGAQSRALDEIKPEDRTKIIGKSNVIVDGLAGTGLSGPLSSKLQSILKEIKDFRSESSRLIAIDIPSGLVADLDVIQKDPYIGGHADNTFVIQGYKMANLAPGSERYCGELRLLDIGMPRFSEGGTSSPKHLVTHEQVASCLDLHTSSNLTHKGQRGQVLVVGGSERMLGAPILSSLGVFKAGAGKVTTTFPKNKASTEPTVMTLPLELEEGCYSITSIDLVRQAIPGKQALVLGPGLGLSKGVEDFVQGLLPDIKKSNLSTVLDADAITLVSRIREKEEITFSDKFVITPHEGEFQRLEMAYFKNSILKDSRYEATKRLSNAMNANILLKGPKSLFFDIKSGAFYNEHQSASLAVAGSGDVLSGLMAGFFARGYSVKEGAIVAMFIHGYVGKILDLDFIDGVGVDAKTILNTIPRAYRDLLLS